MKQWKGYEKGINFGGWLSQCDHTISHYDSFIQSEDFAKVKEWGLDHIRIPVDYDLIMDEGGVFRELGFRYLDFAIAECRKNGLNMILDLHRTPGFSFDPAVAEHGFFESARYQDLFYRIWEAFAERYGEYEDSLAFELLNEVTEKEYCDAWNRIADTCIKRIRRIAPTVSILVGGYWNNSVEAVRDIGFPQDEHIIYNFHCYEPLLFTHQGARWISSMALDFRCPFKMPYSEYAAKSVEHLGAAFSASFDRFNPQDTPDASYFEALFADAIAAADERNVPLYCGEYGVIDLVDPEEALLWYEAFHAAMRKHSIGSAAWSYRKMDFGIVDERMDGVRERLLAVLRHD
ncbi:MAG: cellulase family glycosylhydrolase [Lachnospiraceae bacterium]|nr:cellulase family glycosylhydrolase [Lachnospiraceae bacterium]